MILIWPPNFRADTHGLTKEDLATMEREGAHSISPEKLLRVHRLQAEPTITTLPNGNLSYRPNHVVIGEGIPQGPHGQLYASLYPNRSYIEGNSLAVETLSGPVFIFDQNNAPVQTSKDRMRAKELSALVVWRTRGSAKRNIHEGESRLYVRKGNELIHDTTVQENVFFEIDAPRHYSTQVAADALGIQRGYHADIAALTPSIERIRDDRISLNNIDRLVNGMLPYDRPK